MGVRFYSRLPTGTSPHETPALDRMAPALGLVSLVVGLGPAALLALFVWLGLPSFLASILAVTALVIVTGAMAEDALADSFDGLWGGTDRDRRLEIMHDSRHGTYGVLAMVLLILARVAALSTLSLSSPLAGAAMWLGAQTVARQTALWLPVRLSPARPDGAGQRVGMLGAGRFWFGATMAGLVCLILAGPSVGLVGVAIALILAGLIIIGWSYLSARKVDGFTGDLIGGGQALVEIGLLSAFILFV